MNLWPQFLFAGIRIDSINDRRSDTHTGIGG
jgi:hypothetical protein